MTLHFFIERDGTFLNSQRSQQDMHHAPLNHKTNRRRWKNQNAELFGIRANESA